MFARRFIASALATGVIAVFPAAYAAETAPTPDLEKAIQFPVEKYKLANGLTVLLNPDNSIPSVSIQTWYRVGSKDEHVGRTGLAHFFEHMMFKGTAKYDKNTWRGFLNSKGADFNASTNTDYTNYYINASSENLDVLLSIESDRMRNLLLDPKEVASEREVVKEERRMRYDDSVEGSMHEAMAALLWTKLPYRWLPIGSMVDLNQASMEDLHAFYKEFYSPNNAVLVVAGDFDPAAAKRLIEKYYGGLPQEKIVRPEITPEPEQRAPREVKITRDAQAPMVSVAYHLPDLNNPDLYALDLLSIVLGQGNSSRFYQKLVREKELATSAWAASDNSVLAGEFILVANLKPKTDPSKALAAMELEMKEVRHNLVSQKELDKARNIFMKEYVDRLKRISGRARMLANYETVYGDYTRIFSDLKRYQAVTPDDLKRVANAYLRPSQRNTVIVLPRKAGGHK
jgi:zinc protease